MSVWDRIASSVAVDATARAVTSNGVGYKPSIAPTSREDSETPIPMQPVPPCEKDLTALVMGRLTVLGRAIGRANTKGAPWVVRCKCGRYAIRRTKAIKNPNNAHDRCAECSHTERLLRHSTFQTTGSFPKRECRP